MMEEEEFPPAYLRSCIVDWTRTAPLVVLLTLAAYVPLSGQESPALKQPPIGDPTVAESWWDKLRSHIDLHRTRVNVWPEPFVARDRELVRGPFRQMVDNGWKSQNTLSDYLFDPGTNELTGAGQAKLNHILTQIPPHRRQVYVLEAATPEETATRVTSVQRYVAQIAPNSNPCAVMTTKIVPRGGEGWYAYDVEQAYRSFVPPPRLSAGAAGGGFQGAENSNNGNNGSGGGTNSGNGGNTQSGR